jgi:hypothetical protein
VSYKPLLIISILCWNALCMIIFKLRALHSQHLLLTGSETLIVWLWCSLMRLSPLWPTLCTK